MRLVRSSPTAPWLGSLVASAICGCSSVALEVSSREAYFSGDFDGSAALLEELIEEVPRDAHIWNLDLALTELARGNPWAALERLEQSEAAVRSRSAYGESELDLSRTLSEVRAAVSDDRTLPYRCRDYERMMLYATLTLTHLLVGGPDAYPNALRAEAERDRLIAQFRDYTDPDGARPKAAYRLIGLGDYLRSALVEENPVHASEARHFYERFVELVPDYPFAGEDLDRLAGRTRRRNGTGALYVLAYVGQGPWIESREHVGPLDEIRRWIEYVWRVKNNQIPIPDVTAIQVPELVFAPATPSHINVSVGGTTTRTAIVTDIEAVAHAEFEAMRKPILARAFLRRVVKVAIGAAAERNLGDEWALLIRIGTWLWTGLERADTRAWDQLPATVQALRLELPAGEHAVTLAPASGNSAGEARTVRLSIREGRHTYLFVAAPDAWQLSAPVVSGLPTEREALGSSRDASTADSLEQLGPPSAPASASQQPFP